MEKNQPEKKTRQPRKVSLENFDLTKLPLEQKIKLQELLKASIDDDKRKLEAQLSLINGKP